MEGMQSKRHRKSCGKSKREIEKELWKEREREKNQDPAFLLFFPVP